MDYCISSIISKLIWKTARASGLSLQLGKNYKKKKKKAQESPKPNYIWTANTGQPTGKYHGAKQKELGHEGWGGMGLGNSMREVLQPPYTPPRARTGTPDLF